MRRLAIVALLFVAGRAAAQDSAVQQLLTDADRYYDAGEYDRAASSLDRAIRAQPKEVPPAAYAKRATIYLFEKKYQDGLNWIAVVAERTWPGDDTILEQKAVMYSRLPGGRRDGAVLAEEITKRRPQLYTLHILAADYYYQAGAGAADKTVSHYEDYLRYRPSDLSGKDGLVRVKLGFSYLHLGKFKLAEGQFDEAVRTSGGDADVAPNARKGLCAAYTGEQSWDRAVTVCERVINDKKALKGDPSPYYNVGLAYLARERLDDALAAANTYIQVKAKDTKGYLLRGAVYFRRDRLNEAEGQYNKAAELAPNDPEVARELGKVYLKQKRPGKAIEKLSRALQANLEDVEIIAALAEAYLADGQGQNAATQAERGLTLPGQDKSVRFMTLVGEGKYQAGDLPGARMAFEKAIAFQRAAGGSEDARVRTLLVDTINRQAAVKFKADDLAGAEDLLAQAKGIDPASVRTNFNLGLLAIERGRYADAIKYLSVRLAKSPTDLLTNRLLARAYLGMRDAAKAGEHYAKAEAEAKLRRNRPVLAEIEVEWAPLLLAQGKLDDAIAKLDEAIEYARGQPFEKAARRNLQLAHFQRGYERLRGRKSADAVADLELATKEPALLEGNEESVYNFALGLAYLDVGQVGKASALFQGLSESLRKKGGNVPWLKPPFDSLGADLLLGYTFYREGSVASRARAAAIFEKLLTRVGGAGGAGGGTVAKLKDLLRSTWEYAAYEQFLRGADREAEIALRKADVAASGGDKRVIEHNLAVLGMDKNTAAAKSTLERLKDRVPEALVNLGILADREGNAKAAYDYWTAARARGARSTRLDEWIEAKVRIYGF